MWLTWERLLRIWQVITWIALALTKLDEAIEALKAAARGKEEEEEAEP